MLMNWTKAKLHEFYKENKKMILSSTHEELIDKWEPFLSFSRKYIKNKNNFWSVGRKWDKEELIKYFKENKDKIDSYNWVSISKINDKHVKNFMYALRCGRYWFSSLTKLYKYNGYEKKSIHFIKWTRESFIKYFLDNKEFIDNHSVTYLIKHDNKKFRSFYTTLTRKKFWFWNLRNLYISLGYDFDNRWYKYLWNKKSVREYFKKNKHIFDNKKQEYRVKKDDKLKSFMKIVSKNSRYKLGSLTSLYKEFNYELPDYLRLKYSWKWNRTKLIDFFQRNRNKIINKKIHNSKDKEILSFYRAIVGWRYWFKSMKELYAYFWISYKKKVVTRKRKWTNEKLLDFFRLHKSRIIWKGYKELQNNKDYEIRSFFRATRSRRYKFKSIEDYYKSEWIEILNKKCYKWSKQKIEEYYLDNREYINTFDIKGSKIRDRKYKSFRDAIFKKYHWYNNINEVRERFWDPKHIIWLSIKQYTDKIIKISENWIIPEKNIFIKEWMFSFYAHISRTYWIEKYFKKYWLRPNRKRWRFTTKKEVDEYYKRHIEPLKTNEKWFLTRTWVKKNWFYSWYIKIAKKEVWYEWINDFKEKNNIRISKIVFNFKSKADIDKYFDKYIKPNNSDKNYMKFDWLIENWHNFWLVSIRSCKYWYISLEDFRDKHNIEAKRKIRKFPSQDSLKEYYLNVIIKDREDQGANITSKWIVENWFWDWYSRVTYNELWYNWLKDFKRQNNII